MQFRQKALSTLRSPEELDLPVRFARPQGRLVLVVTVAVMAAATWWALTGSVSAKVSAQGILTHAAGSYTTQSPVAGQVTRVLAEEGQLLSPNDPLLTVTTAEGAEHEVTAVAGGRLTTLVVTAGAVIRAGAEVATLEQVTDPDEPLVAVLYLPPGSGSAIPVDATVDLSVQSVPRERFGVLRGRVEAVGRAPLTERQIAGFLGDSALAAEFSREGSPVAVLVRLERSSTTESGYTWSSDDGPPFAIASRTPVTGSVHLSAERPVDWLLP
ncbi:HlyD family efflux transporter periplasmic adaptor subunit [Streptomyces litchfieldiae]|uniref:HlyD family efflux transporter periplasmic adaptor subunit n=1 Tax=Streptomyces litchfieldiae TaxID=3075543 RepID=A0ABU2MJ45_9ACTN|nr:HlyD family efflux transporter periplasmic adaptor subunit [Streptomyces sp. DSM 44938]MDT0341505.1 HlyD family efflux transporter periplasmic adaptor subunit [Streptomyces sp. DSM 44938]